MIDFTGLDLTTGSTPQTLTGMYEKVKTAISLNMPIYVVNASWGDSAVTPIQVFAIAFDGYITITASTLQVIVTSADAITINNLAPEG